MVTENPTSICCLDAEISAQVCRAAIASHRDKAVNRRLRQTLAVTSCLGLAISWCSKHSIGRAWSSAFVRVCFCNFYTKEIQIMPRGDRGGKRRHGQRCVAANCANTHAKNVNLHSLSWWSKEKSMKTRVDFGTHTSLIVQIILLWTVIPSCTDLSTRELEKRRPKLCAGNAVENETHYLWDCSKYENERNMFINST